MRLRSLFHGRRFTFNRFCNSNRYLVTSLKMSTEKEWVPPPKIEELYAATSGNKFGNINAPTAGARVQQDVPPGQAPFQLYSLCTPNGQKISIMLEELGIDYDAHGTTTCSCVV